MRTNNAVKQTPVYTHEGAQAIPATAEVELSRAIMACMLWEDTFYESGVDIGERIKALVPLCRPDFVAACAYYARWSMKLRHAPLLLVREMARLATHKHLVARLLPDVIGRVDEIPEFLAIYWKEKKQPLSAQVKRGLATAFTKFDEHQLAKYDRDHAVKLRDALFLSHAKPADVQGHAGYTKIHRKDGVPHNFTAGEQLFKKIVDRTLATPDTWEVELSKIGATQGSEEDKVLAKRGTWLRLMAEKKLGALAFLRNLRNMTDVGIEKAEVIQYAGEVNIERVLPFRFIAAARAVPAWEEVIEPMMLRCLEGQAKLAGKTTLLIDVSGSMEGKVSGKSDITRLDAGCGLAILLREICEEVRVFTFSEALIEIAPRRGFALRDAIVNSQPHSNTLLGQAVAAMPAGRDRLIIITDEQSHDKVMDPPSRGYMLNVSTYKHGVGYGKWTRIDGWSEAIVDYIVALEAA